jgi:hypothetical protein
VDRRTRRSPTRSSSRGHGGPRDRGDACITHIREAIVNAKETHGNGRKPAHGTERISVPAQRGLHPADAFVLKTQTNHGVRDVCSWELRERGQGRQSRTYRHALHQPHVEANLVPLHDLSSKRKTTPTEHWRRMSRKREMGRRSGAKFFTVPWIWKNLHGGKHKGLVSCMASVSKTHLSVGSGLLGLLPHECE